MFQSSGNTIEGGFTAAERVLFIRIFWDKLNVDIPALLFNTWDLTQFRLHKLPTDMKFADKLELYGTPSLTGTSIISIDEYADYLNLPDVDDPEKIIEKVETLAKQAAESYAWNIRNAYIKNGRLRLNQKLHATDWDGAFKVNIVKNSEASVGGCPGDLIPGWIAYRYRFAAAKLL
jgi:hypothetical protein